MIINVCCSGHGEHSILGQEKHFFFFLRLFGGLLLEDFKHILVLLLVSMHVYKIWSIFHVSFMVSNLFSYNFS